VNKTKELEESISEIDMQKIKHLHKRILYFFLHSETSIKKIN